MKCEICNGEAVYRFSPDVDIEGLGACEKDREYVQAAYIILVNEGSEAFNSFMKSLRKNGALDSQNPGNPPAPIPKKKP